jgi:hypothetical protein
MNPGVLLAILVVDAWRPVVSATDTNKVRSFFIVWGTAECEVVYSDIT